MPRAGFLVVGGASLAHVVPTFGRFGDVRVAIDASAARGALDDPAIAAVVSGVEDPREGLSLIAEARGRDGRRRGLVVVFRAADAEVLNRAFDVGAHVLHAPLRDAHALAFARLVASARADGGEPIATTVEARAAAWRLSPRETELLVHAVNGASREEIVVAMGVTENTLKTQIRALLRKADYHHLDELVADVLRAAVPSSSEAVPSRSPSVPSVRTIRAARAMRGGA